jgi:hypothetical protein
MRYTTNEIVERVRVLLDHARESGELFALDDADALSIDAIIRSKIVPASRQTLLLAPIDMIDTGKPLPGRLSWPDAPGIGMGLLRLPDDYLRLLSIMLSDWKRPASIITEDDPEYLWQSNRFAGVRGNPDRPIAAIVRYPGGLMAECYSSRGGEGVTMKRGLYLQEPEIEDGGIELPVRCVEAVIRMTAAMACMTLGDYTTAGVMRKQGLETLGVREQESQYGISQGAQEGLEQQ